MHIPLFKLPSDGIPTDLMQKFYRHRGFMILDNFIIPSTLKLLRERAYSLASEVINGSQPVIHPQHITQWSMKDLETTTRSYCCYWTEPKNDSPPQLLKISHALHRLEPIIQNFIKSSNIIRLTQSLALKQPKIVQSMLHFKPPQSSSSVDWHQDATYISTTPHSTLGLWIALEDATIDNGCLRVIPMPPNPKLCSKMTRSNFGKLSFEVLHEQEWPIENAINLPVRAGSLIVLNGLLPHSSGPNFSQQSRLSLTLHLVDLMSKYSENNWLPFQYL